MKPRNYSGDERQVRLAKGIHLAAAVMLTLSGGYLALCGESNGASWNTLLAINLILIGAAGAYGFFSNDLYRLAFQCDLALGAFSVALGIVMLALGEPMAAYFPLLPGLYVLLDGMQKVQIAVEGARFGIRHWQLILASAIVVAGMGMVSLLCGIRGETGTLWPGLAIMLDGVENFWTTMYTVRLRRSHPQ